MRYYYIFLVTLYVLVWSVNRALDDAEKSAYKNIDEHERVAWSNGFERGVKSVSR